MRLVEALYILLCHGLRFVPTLFGTGNIYWVEVKMVFIRRTDVLVYFGRKYKLLMLLCRTLVQGHEAVLMIGRAAALGRRTGAETFGCSHARYIHNKTPID